MRLTVWDDTHVERELLEAVVFSPQKGTELQLAKALEATCIRPGYLRFAGKGKDRKVWCAEQDPAGLWKEDKTIVIDLDVGTFKFATMTAEKKK